MAYSLLYIENQAPRQIRSTSGYNQVPSMSCIQAILCARAAKGRAVSSRLRSSFSSLPRPSYTRHVDPLTPKQMHITNRGRYSMARLRRFARTNATVVAAALVAAHATRDTAASAASTLVAASKSKYLAINAHGARSHGLKAVAMGPSDRFCMVGGARGINASNGPGARYIGKRAGGWSHSHPMRHAREPRRAPETAGGG
jgi:hypothetical protein